MTQRPISEHFASIPVNKPPTCVKSADKDSPESIQAYVRPNSEVFSPKIAVSAEGMMIYGVA